MSAATRHLSRRQALGLAAGSVAGAAGVGLVGAKLPGLFTVAPAAGSAANGDWGNQLGSARVLAAHLLRRAGFGYTGPQLDQAATLSYGDLVDQVVGQTPEALPSVTNPSSYQQVVAAWYGHMAVTAAQFPERMTLFWHGLLTSDFRSAARLPLVLQQNQLYRSLGRGDLRSLLVAVTYDPLMIRYLDLEQSTPAAPNENYSRELMELFTLGAGNYTETDVREGARALSGVRMLLVDANGSPIRAPRVSGMTAQQYAAAVAQLLAQGASFKGTLVGRQHDSGVKTYLGRTGNLGPDDIIDAVLAQTACAPHIATKALVHFCTPSPSPALVNSVAAQFRNSGYDIKALMRAIFMSDDFKSSVNYRSLVRSPADLMVATMRALNRSDLARTAMKAGAGMNQILYDMPNVAGWPSNAGWISSTAWLSRVNFAAAAVASHGVFPDPGQAVKDQLDGVLSADTTAVFNAASAATDRWYALLASPEFNLK
jgi:uncharacterized protein (DUF1800 family)